MIEVQSFIRLIIFSVSLQLTQAGNFPDKYGAVSPADPFIYIGENLTLLCNMTARNTHASSNQMMFKKDRELLDTTYITRLSPRVILLQFPITSLQDEGEYWCYFINETSELFIGFQKVRVEYPLEPIRSVECRYAGEETLFCNWTAVQYNHSDIINTSLQYRIVYDPSFGQGNWMACKTSSVNSCFWQQQHLLSSNDINMVITTRNTFTGEFVKSQQFNITLKDHIQPYSVMLLRVTQVDSRCLTLNWSVVTDENTYLYKVQITSNWDDDEQEFKTENKYFNTCELIPYTKYEIRVRRIVQKSGHSIGWWSDPANISVTSNQSAPVKTPHSCHGCFTFTDDGQVKVYFQRLRKQDWYGPELRYVVNITDTGKRETWTYVLSASSDTLTTHRTDHSLSVDIYTLNTVGVSEKSTSLFIPGKDRALKPPDHIVVELVRRTENENIYHLTWKAKHSLDNLSYTVFWCQREQHQTQCSGTLHWKEFIFKKYEEYIQVKNINFQMILFGMSVERRDNTGQIVSSGIQWQPCVYDATRAPLPPKKVHFVDQWSANSLILAWTKPFCAETPAILYFILTYCKADGVDADVQCSEPARVRNISSDVTIYSIGDLEDGFVYKAHLQSASKHSVSVQSNSVSKRVTNSSNSKVKINIYFIALLIIPLLLIIIYLCKRYKLCEKFQIKYPDRKQHNRKTVTLNQEHVKLYESNRDTETTDTTCKDEEVGLLEGVAEKPEKECTVSVAQAEPGTRQNSQVWKSDQNPSEVLNGKEAVTGHDIRETQAVEGEKCNSEVKDIEIGDTANNRDADMSLKMIKCENLNNRTKYSINSLSVCDYVTVGM